MAKEVVSGAGKFAKRVDKNISKRTTQPIRDMGSRKYGEGVALNQLQSSAPMQGASAKTPKINPQMQPNGFPTLTQETQRPFESPDTGMPFGEGPGPAEVGLGLGTGDPESPQKKDLQRLTTLLPMIERAALTADAPESLRTFVKYLKGSKTETINRDLTQGA